jgi:Asp-tRNA(Asn)/Glu-tRNA(Gln) amidotransferase A subunit family amidase
MMGVAQAVALLSRRELSAEELVRQCLARIEEREPDVQAWQVVDREGALREARRIDGLRERPLLCGVPAGIKDLIDTFDLPTEYGSPIHRGHQPPRDAGCVRALRQAGAVVLGKTVTTEFAVYTPGKTRNPRDTSRTPGGSSSGSAAAVACGMVPFALGTQTAGSVIRPASYCGVIGWKGSFGWASLEGVHPLAPSLDTLGFFVRELDDIPLVLTALTGKNAQPGPLPKRFGFCRTELWDRVEPAARKALEDAARRLARSGVEVVDVELPPGLFAAQIAIMNAEAAVSLRDKPREQLSPRLREMLDEGLQVSPAQLLAARELARSTEFPQVDAILAAAAPGEAPTGLAATGDPALSRIWTLLGTPCISLPLLHGPAQLPIGLQLIARRGEDQRLLAAAAYVLENVR